MNQAWVPVDTCTLPTVEQPVRMMEFDLLFAERLIGVDKTSAERAVLVLRGGPGVADAVEDLVTRESSCCSFFEFSLERGEAELRLEVSVSVAHVAVLAALTDRAERLGLEVSR